MSCPSCGYCSHCGRSGQGWRQSPYFPWNQWQGMSGTIQGMAGTAQGSIGVTNTQGYGGGGQSDQAHMSAPHTQACGHDHEKE